MCGEALGVRQCRVAKMSDLLAHALMLASERCPLPTGNGVDPGDEEEETRAGTGVLAACALASAFEPGAAGPKQHDLDAFLAACRPLSPAARATAAYVLISSVPWYPAGHEALGRLADVLRRLEFPARATNASGTSAMNAALRRGFGEVATAMGHTEGAPLAPEDTGLGLLHAARLGNPAAAAELLQQCLDAQRSGRPVVYAVDQDDRGATELHLEGAVPAGGERAALAAAAGNAPAPKPRRPGKAAKALPHGKEPKGGKTPKGGGAAAAAGAAAPAKAAARAGTSPAKTEAVPECVLDALDAALPECFSPDCGGTVAALCRVVPGLATAKLSDKGPSCTILHCAAARSSPGAVAAALGAGADAGFSRNHRRWAPLHCVGTAHEARPGDARACVVLLLGAGADPEAADKRGRTPLWIAATEGDVAAVQAMVADAGASGAVVAGKVREPLLLACLKQLAGKEHTTELVERVKALRSAGAKLAPSTVPRPAARSDSAVGARGPASVDSGDLGDSDSSAGPSGLSVPPGERSRWRTDAAAVLDRWADCPSELMEELRADLIEAGSPP